MDNKMYNNNLNKGKQDKYKKEQEKSNDKYELRIEPEVFEATTEVKLLRTSDLSAQVNTILKAILPHDHEGCVVNVDQQGNLRCHIYLKDISTPAPGDSSIKALVSLKAEGNSRAAIISNMNSLNKHKYYKLSDDAKDILERFVPQAYKRGNKIDWKNLEQEQTSQDYMGYGSYTVYMAIELDMLALIKTIWGTKKDGNPVDYTARVVRSVGGAMSQTGGMSSDWLVEISRYNSTAIADVCKKVGLITSENGIPMYKA